jgi:hypothetical protein
MKYTSGPWKLNKLRYYGTTYEISTLDGKAICDLWAVDVGEEQREANVHLIASCPDLLEEHKQWARIQGRIIVEALQGNFEYLKVIAQTAQIEYVNGKPFLKSEAIAKAEPTES